MFSKGTLASEPPHFRYHIFSLKTLGWSGVRLPDDRHLYIAPFGIPRKWPSRRLTLGTINKKKSLTTMPLNNQVFKCWSEKFHKIKRFLCILAFDWILLPIFLNELDLHHAVDRWKLWISWKQCLAFETNPFWPNRPVIFFP